MANNWWSESSQGTGRLTQGLAGWVRWNHNHRRRSARLKRSRSRTPRPPRSRGRQTLAQATLHRPPEQVTSAAHNHARRILSTAFTSHTGGAKTEKR
jgi:hypothetical protein